MQIHDLRDCPEFFDIVSDRVWRAWWKPFGHSLADVAEGLRRTLTNDAVPFAIVAANGRQYLGSALAIECDLAERPQYKPWVAAVWVEPEHRLKTVGRSLVSFAVRSCSERGFARVYLCSSPERLNFYTRQGWIPIEHGVGRNNQTIYVQHLR